MYRPLNFLGHSTSHTRNPFPSYLDTASSKFNHSGAGSKHKAASTSTIEISVQAAVLAHPQQGVLLQCQGCCPGSSSTRCPSTGYPIFCVTGVSKSQLLVNILLLASMVTGRFLHSLHTVCKLRWL